MGIPVTVYSHHVGQYRDFDPSPLCRNDRNLIAHGLKAYPVDSIGVSGLGAFGFRCSGVRTVGSRLVFLVSETPNVMRFRLFRVW